MMPLEKREVIVTVVKCKSSWIHGKRSRLSSLIAVLVGVPTLLLASEFLDSYHRVKDLNEVLGCWFPCGPALAVWLFGE